MKGRQVPVTLYLGEKQYWLLRSFARESGFSMQFLLRRAVYEAIKEASGLNTTQKDPRIVAEHARKAVALSNAYWARAAKNRL